MLLHKKFWDFVRKVNCLTNSVLVLKRLVNICETYVMGKKIRKLHETVKAHNNLGRKYIQMCEDESTLTRVIFIV